ncbi:sensor histidine kinase [Streptococcus massiliensis]|uniref:histidine kinase n=1 Tax=Streptococcus massiliensis TaxID=313439 RepID=A0A380L075_9STRE|nr:sensor histidine kinase [Streptococcus massiliensis]SUN77419.1 putative signal transduction histidine kinase [Streptococcus massiliensis]
MTSKEKLHFIKGYISSRRYFLLLLFLFFFVLGLLTFLYTSQGQMINYISLLLFFLGFPLLSLDVFRNYQQFKHLLWEREDIVMQSGSEQLLLERLQESQQKLQNLDEAERQKRSEAEDYFTLWAHQIKTPIAASRLLVDNLAETNSRQALQQELFKIEAYANLVLQYLRLESFHDDLVLKKENLADVVKEAVKKYSLFFIQKHLSLNLHDLDYEFVTDRKWFLIVLEQILSNSVKYTNQGGVEIYVKDDSLYLVDTGLGIQESDLQRVFERGFSGYNGRLTQQSSGLGLYLTKQILDKLDYPIMLKSKVGQGTTVKIDLKRRQLVFE